MAAEIDARAVSATSPDVAHFERLLEPVLRPAFRLAHAMLRDRQEAEDAVQEAALTAWRAFDTFDERGRGLQPWFLTIVANQCRDRLRGRWWRVWRQPDISRGATPGPEGGVVLRAQLVEALDRLTPEHRAALYLRYQLDLPNEEVARILRLRVGTVKSRLHRALRQLRSTIDLEELDHEA
jgi:RNA polymerase sigma-70 factor (ECF subfamily)